MEPVRLDHAGDCDTIGEAAERRGSTRATDLKKLASAFQALYNGFPSSP